MVTDKTRPQFVWPHNRCSRVYRFLFEWDDDSKDLTKATIRVYKEVVNRLIPGFQRNVTGNASVSVNVSISLEFAGSQSELANDSSIVDRTWKFLKTIDVAPYSDSWLELDVADQLEDACDLELNQTIVDIVVRFDVDCDQQKKVPIRISNPIAYGHNSSQRQRLMKFEPFFVAFLDDVKIKDKVKNDYISDLGNAYTPDQDIQGDINKRSLVDEPNCGIEDFMVNFTTLGIVDVIHPIGANIRRCTGGCSLFHFPEISHLSSNHARLLATAYHLHTYYTEKASFPVVPQDPCCSAISYFPIYLTIIHPITQKLELRMYDEFIVKNCGCR